MSDDPTQQTPAEDNTADETGSHEAAAEYAVPEHAVPEHAVSPEPAPDEIAPAAAVEEEAVSEEAVSEQAAPEELTSVEVALDIPGEAKLGEVEAVESEAGEPEAVEAEPGEEIAEPEEQPARPALAPRHEMPRTPDRWLVLQASAVLAAVAVTNYVCYGGSSVPRYGEAPVPQPPRDPSILCAEIIARGPATESQEGVLRLAELDLRFRQVEQSERQVIWAWNEPARWLQVYWVWDFFRLQSHIALRVGLPAPGHDPESGWAGTLAAVRAIAPGDTISVRVQSPCGNIHQVHPVTAAAVEWQPPAPADPRRGPHR